MKLSTRMMLAMVSLVLMTTSIIGWLNLRNIKSVVLPRALGALQSQANLLAIELEAAVRGAAPMHSGFKRRRRSPASSGEPVPGDLTHVKQLPDLRARLAGRFHRGAECEAKLFRISHHRGRGWWREIIRVDRMGPGGTTRVVEPHDLQTQGEREFFKRAIELPLEASMFRRSGSSRTTAVSFCRRSRSSARPHRSRARRATVRPGRH